MNDVYFLPIDSYNQKDFEKLLNLVPSFRKEKILKLLKQEDQALSLFAFLLLKYVYETTNLKPLPELAIGEHGKPYFKDPTDLHFNLSHTRSAVALALSESPVGIDIEAFKTPNLSITERFFTKDEQDYINADNSCYRFFEVWTKKEAFVKKTGLGFSKNMPNSFSVFKTDAVFKDFSNDDYIITVCSDLDFDFMLHKISLNDLTEFFFEKQK